MSPELTSVLSRVAVLSHRRRYRTASGSDRARSVASTHRRRLRPLSSVRTPSLKLNASSISFHRGGINMKEPKRRIILFALLLLPLVIALPIVIASNQSATVLGKPQGSSTTSMLWHGSQGSMKREREADRMARLFLPEVVNDTSPQLRDMVQVPVTSSQVGFRQSTKGQERITTRGTGSGAILVAGILPETNGEVGATQRVKIDSRGYQIFDNLTGTSVLGPSDVATIWAGFGGSCETGGAGEAVVLYDKVAGRWVISQFASATGGKTATEECFAVSATSDATGSYYRY